MSTDIANDLLLKVPGLRCKLEDLRSVPLAASVPPPVMQTLSYFVQSLVPDLDRRTVFDGQVTLDRLATIVREATEASSVDERLERGYVGSRDLVLRPVYESDLERLYAASLDPGTGHFWRFRGATPSPQQFASAVFGSDVLCQFMAVPPERPDLSFGQVVCYGADSMAGHAHVGVLSCRSPELKQVPPVMIEALHVFVLYLFDHFRLQKIYLDIPEFNAHLVEGLVGPLLVEEGRLLEHYYFQGRRWGQLTLALYWATYEAFVREVRRPARET